MSVSLVLVVLVTATEVRSPTTVAVRDAAHEVLGQDSQVRVEAFSRLPTDAELESREQAADAVVTLNWQDQTQQRATVHCYVERWHRFVNRELVFAAQDDMRERGRMLGFAIASMLPEWQADPEGPTRPEPEVSQGSARNHAPRPEFSAERVSVSATASRAPGFVGAIDTSGLVAIAEGGSGIGLGLAGRWFFHRGLSLRVSAGTRSGTVPAAAAESVSFFGGVGLGFQLSSADSGAPFSLGGRADFLVAANTLRRPRRVDGIPESQTRFQPATDLLLEAAWYFWSNTAILAAAGGEVALTHTDVVVSGKEVADLPEFKGVAELGVRARF